ADRDPSHPWQNCFESRRRKEMNLMMTRIVLIAAFLVIAATLHSATMKAIVAHEYGGPEVLKYEDAPRPEPKEEQILVGVIAAGVNPVDGMIRSGMFSK